MVQILRLYKDDIKTQRVGKNYSLVIPGYGGEGNSLEVIFDDESLDEFLSDVKQMRTENEEPEGEVE